MMDSLLCQVVYGNTASSIVSDETFASSRFDGNPTGRTRRRGIEQPAMPSRRDNRKERRSKGRRSSSNQSIVTAETGMPSVFPSLFPSEVDWCRLGLPASVCSNQATTSETYEKAFTWGEATTTAVEEGSRLHTSAEDGTPREVLHWSAAHDNAVHRLRILTSAASLKEERNSFQLHQKMLLSHNLPKLQEISSASSSTSSSLHRPPARSRQTPWLGTEKRTWSEDQFHRQKGLSMDSWEGADDGEDPPLLTADDGSSMVSLTSLEQDILLADAVLKEVEILEALQSQYFPICKQGEAFWLQYSMIRDGASLDILLDKVRDSEHTLLAIETMEGERFGGFCARPWRYSQTFYGSGQSFLFRIPQETGLLEVFPFAYANHNIQMCKPDRLILGGGGTCGRNSSKHCSPDSKTTKKQMLRSRTPSGIGTGRDYGFGLWLEEDLLRGSSSPCKTFASPALSELHQDGSTFEVRNLEVWALTPCRTVEEAEKNQRARQYWSKSQAYFQQQCKEKKGRSRYTSSKG